MSWLLHHTPPSRQQGLSLAQSSCVSQVELTDGWLGGTSILLCDGNFDGFCYVSVEILKLKDEEKN